MNEMKNNETVYEEKLCKAPSGMLIMLLNILAMFLAVGGIILDAAVLNMEGFFGIFLFVLCILYLIFIGPVLFCGLKVLKPNEALVLTLFGKYYGTLKGPGFFFVNPFVTAVNPAAATAAEVMVETAVAAAAKGTATAHTAAMPSKKISLKAITFNNDKQKINDLEGNPIIIGFVVIWRVVNTAKAVFNVDNYQEYLSIQCDSALRNIVRLYPYDISEEGEEKSLRGSSQEVSERLKTELQEKVNIAGLEILEARITHLAYAPEIAAAMLQRQQASAIIEARQKIVEGAVGMVEMALERLNENQIVNLDEERKAAMVSNLLVVLCGNKDAQPVVNSGSIY